MFYWKEKGEDASIEAAIMTISNCLRELVGPSNCSEVFEWRSSNNFPVPYRVVDVRDVAHAHIQAHAPRLCRFCVNYCLLCTFMDSKLSLYSASIVFRYTTLA